MYILRCADDSLYTGITNDLEHRIEQHESGKGAKFTRGRGPLKIVYTESVETHSLALKREREIKALRRPQKLSLLGTH